MLLFGVLAEATKDSSGTISSIHVVKDHEEVNLRATAEEEAMKEVIPIEGSEGGLGESMQPS